MKSRLRLCVLMLAAQAGFASVAGYSQAAAQDYPAKQINVVLGFSAGGGTDTIARIIAAKLAENLGVAVVVENRPGANGNIAAQQVTRSQPDGYTLLANTSSVILNPLLGMKQAVDTDAALAPISETGIIPYALVTPASLAPSNISEFVSYAKANKGKLRYSSGGVGNMTHLANVLFQNATGISAVHIPYKGGTPALTATMGGEVQFYLGPVSSVPKHIKAGRLKGLAVTSLKRATVLPEVPTMNETVAKGFEAGSWYGFMAPAQTPDSIVAKLHAEIVKALQDPDLATKLARSSVEVKTSTPKEYAAFLKNERNQWARVIKNAGIKVN